MWIFRLCGRAAFIIGQLGKNKVGFVSLESIPYYYSIIYYYHQTTQTRRRLTKKTVFVSTV